MSRNLKLLIALIITATVASYVIFVFIPEQIAKKTYAGAREIGKQIRDVFQFTPEVKVENTVVLNQQTPIFELAVLSQKFEHRYTWEHSWLGSTKKIFITGTFNAKIGFDLHKKVTITLRNDRVYVRLPQPTTLSVESVGDIEYRDEQGIWNWVNMDNRTRATNAFIADARQFANRASFEDQAKAEVEKRLIPLLSPYAEEVIIFYGEPLDFED